MRNRAKLISAALAALALGALVAELAHADVLPAWQTVLDWLGRWWIVGLVITLAAAAAVVWWRSRPKTTPAEKPPVDRTQLATMVTAFTALGALVFTALSLRATHDQIAVAEQGQITDRYTKAIDQLGRPDLQVRLGGIFALERIAVDSPRDRLTVVEVLSAFIRTASPRQATCPKTPADVQAAFVVLGRRVLTREEFQDRRSNVDLRNTCLAQIEANRADLSLFALEGADLTEAKLNLASGSLVKLAGATLVGAELKGAELNGYVFLEDVDLTGAKLNAAKLGNNFFRNVKLVGADLTQADLTDARIENVDFTGAKHDAAITERAQYDLNTKGAWWVSN
ncbi:hypothetical protein Lesp02_19120 [Lentzea sp. NBRC 105346]|uniref:pentapeptide repeat-containing protein n=1 Tax=Lentzea sp. NBRC 105346 TaxID=3032205 RepID=UPI0024A5C7D9|nr:pentapeptide repeat-containing protein [Lentzea sp. NBRC 105346]GLZ29722.1 hypothetical protein Lesp02_19120 [Lentzea sp. NBRC 105346]